MKVHINFYHIQLGSQLLSYSYLGFSSSALLVRRGLSSCGSYIRISLLSLISGLLFRNEKGSTLVCLPPWFRGSSHGKSLSSDQMHVKVRLISIRFLSGSLLLRRLDPGYRKFDRSPGLQATDNTREGS